MNRNDADLQRFLELFGTVGDEARPTHEQVDRFINALHRMHQESSERARIDGLIADTFSTTTAASPSGNDSGVGEQTSFAASRSVKERERNEQVRAPASARGTNRANPDHWIMTTGGRLSGIPHGQQKEGVEYARKAFVLRDLMPYLTPTALLAVGTIAACISTPAAIIIVATSAAVSLLISSTCVAAYWRSRDSQNQISDSMGVKSVSPSAEFRDPDRETPEPDDSRSSAFLERQVFAQLRGQVLENDGLAENFEARNLYGLIESSALQTDLMIQLVRNATRISPSSPPIIHQFVQAQIKEMSDFVKQLAEGGTITYYGEDREWLLGLTRNATRSVDAISLAATDHDLWQSEIGQRYLDAQRWAAREGRRVRRIFVLDSLAMEQDSMLRREYEEQRSMGIEVRVLERSAVRAPLQVRARGLVVFDNTLAYETVPTTSDSRMAQVAETRLVLASTRVDECSRLFSDLWEVSRELGTLNPTTEHARAQRNLG